MNFGTEHLLTVVLFLVSPTFFVFPVGMLSENNITEARVQQHIICSCKNAYTKYFVAAKLQKGLSFTRKIGQHFST